MVRVKGVGETGAKGTGASGQRVWRPLVEDVRLSRLTRRVAQGLGCWTHPGPLPERDGRPDLRLLRAPFRLEPSVEAGLSALPHCPRLEGMSVSARSEHDKAPAPLWKD